jgi:hypothetical protein
MLSKQQLLGALFHRIDLRWKLLSLSRFVTLVSSVETWLSVLLGTEATIWRRLTISDVETAGLGSKLTLLSSRLRKQR